MSEYLSVVLLALLPAFGNFAGGLLADVFPASGRTLSLALHGAAGIVLAVVGVALMPEVLKADPPWIIVLAFVAGGIFFILADQAMSIVQGRMGDEESESNPWAIFFGVATDLFSDGVMIGAGSAVALSLGLLLALGQVTADIPEGFATITTFKRHGASRRMRFLLSLLFAVPVVPGATIGYGVLRDEPIIAKLALLAFTAGILITVTNVADMIEEGEDLTELSGIGEDLAGKIEEIVRTGSLAQLEEIERRTPPELADLLNISGLGPKRMFFGSERAPGSP